MWFSRVVVLALVPLLASSGLGLLWPSSPPQARAASQTTPSPSSFAAAAAAAETVAEVTAPASSLTGGPRPTRITHDADGSSTTVLAHGLGDADTEQAREGRSMRHSDLQPTGRFVRSGGTLVVDVPEGAPALRLRIGLRGVHSGLNDGRDVGLVEHALRVGHNTITSDRDGAVSLVSTDSAGSSTIRVSGGSPTPIFVRGQHTNADFAEQLAEWPDAPLFTLVGERIFGEFQARSRTALPDDVSARVAEWDRVVSRTNTHYGLLDDAVGLARKAPHRIYVSSPDTGPGYASATHEYIRFQIGTGAASDLLRAPVDDLWGFWHEVGHTYQPPAYNWSGLGEVTVNISASAIAGTTFGTSELDSPGKQAAIAAHFAKPIAARDFHGESIWTKLLLFDQLRRAFGEQFYPRMNQELRSTLALGETTVLDDVDKQQLFARTAARTADRDLRPFFAEWGFPLSDETADVMTGLPALTTSIWRNLVYAETVRETDLAEYSVPTGTVQPVTETVSVGQRALEHAPATTTTGNTDGVGSVSVGTHVVSAVQPDRASVRVELRNERSVREVVTVPVTARTGNSFLFRGASSRDVARLAIDEAAGALRFVAWTSYQSHTSWTGREYLGFELRDAADRVSLGNWSLDGAQNAHRLAARFDREHRGFQDGQIVVIRHQEASGRLKAYRDDVEQSSNSLVEQRFRIADGRFEPILPVPLVAADAPAATLEVGGDAPVEFHLSTGRDLSSIRGEVVATAPTGTTFTPGQTSIAGDYRKPGGAWTRAGSMTLSDGRLSADGRTLTFALRTGSAFTMPGKSELRWPLSVRTPGGTTEVGPGMAWTMSGWVNGETFRAAS